MKRDNQIYSALKAVDFSERYFRLCDDYAGPNDAIRLLKADVFDQVVKFFPGCIYSAGDKMFYFDFTILNFVVRMCIPYQDGLLAPWYVFQIPDEEYRYKGSFSLMGFSEGFLRRKFIRPVYPCVRSKGEVEVILRELAELHKDFTEELVRSLKSQV